MKKKNSIITIFILTIIILLAIVFACFFVFSITKPEQKIITQNTPAIENRTVKKMEGIVIEGDEFNTYRNEKFGFEFQFPKDWAVRESVFRSATTKFNMVIEPTSGSYLPYPIRINILPVEWIESVTKNMTVVKRTSIDGANTTAYSITSEGLPQIEYIFPLDDNKIVIGGKEQYEDTLNGVLSTFKFLK